MNWQEAFIKSVCDVIEMIPFGIAVAIAYVVGFRQGMKKQSE